jgi:hypothetical protein
MMRIVSTCVQNAWKDSIGILQPLLRLESAEDALNQLTCATLALLQTDVRFAETHSS